MVDVDILIERYDLNLRSNGKKKNVWKCNEKDCSFKLSAGRKNGKGVIVFDRKGSFYTHSHDVFEKPKSQVSQVSSVSSLRRGTDRPFFGINSESPS